MPYLVCGVSYLFHLNCYMPDNQNIVGGKGIQQREDGDQERNGSVIRGTVTSWHSFGGASAICPARSPIMLAENKELLF